MDDQAHPNPDFNHTTTYTPESTLHSSGMFSHSQNFTVTGQNLTNITNNNYTTPGVPSDFRMIPIGDIDLQREIRLNSYTGVVDRERACNGRVYSARVEGRKSTLTVAMYQGNGAEEEWRQYIAKHMSMRHPNIIQITGAASSGGIHAILSNDDLMPLQQVLDHYQGSHFSTVYIYASWNEDFSEVFNYITCLFQREVMPSECTKWICRSTGRLCIEFDSTDYMWLNRKQSVSGFQDLYALGVSHTEPINMVFELLTLEQYHGICSNNLGQDQFIFFPTSTLVNLGAVFSTSSGVLKDPVEIASFNPDSYLNSWETSEGDEGVVMGNGWTR
ncbi:hypothetical protein B0H12DRAFT_1328542 [Mycena haematopus]|nr:hypothetical protein B0H12DRAFT_1328542 [Mycena haematopus]